MVAPQPGQAIWVHDAKDFALRVLPADVVLIAAVWQELVDVVPQEPAVCQEKKQKTEPMSNWYPAELNVVMGKTGQKCALCAF